MRVSSNDSDKLSAAPPKGWVAALVFGSNGGLVRERADKLAKAIVPDTSDGFRIADLGADVLRKIMDASFVILRDHPVNEEREADGLKPANCLWLWGQGRAPLWPPLPERYQVSGVVISPSDVTSSCFRLSAISVSICASFWSEAIWLLIWSNARAAERMFCA